MHDDGWELSKMFLGLLIILAILFAWGKITQSIKENSKSNRGIDVVGETLP